MHISQPPARTRRHLLTPPALKSMDRAVKRCMQGRSMTRVDAPCAAPAKTADETPGWSVAHVSATRAHSQTCLDTAGTQVDGPRSQTLHAGRIHDSGRRSTRSTSEDSRRGWGRTAAKNPRGAKSGTRFRADTPAQTVTFVMRHLESLTAAVG